MDLIIRNIEAKDFNIINELFWQSDVFHNNNEPYIYEKTTEGYRSNEYLESILQEKNSMFILLEQNNEIIGFLYAYEEQKGHLPFHKKRKYLVIDNIVIDEKHRKKGYGTKLVNYIIEYGSNKNYDDIVLNVFSFNKDAIKLYEKLGFRKLSQEMILKL